MATLKEALVTVLTSDGDLKTLLGYNASTKPQIVFYQYPKEQIDPPLVIYRIAGESSFKPRDIYFDFLVYGGDIKAIQDRIFELLHKKKELVTTDWQVVGILFESSGPELYDENLKCYFQRARYRIVAWKI